MNRLQLFRLLRRHRRTGNRRNPAFEQNQLAKVIAFIGGGLFLIYMIILGLAFGAMAGEAGAGALIAFMPFAVAVDFLLRFTFQQTPDMLVKPYILLPMSKYAVIETFLATSLLSTYNFLWLGLIVPYSIIALSAGQPLGTVTLVFLTSFTLVLASSQYYLLMRTFINRSQLWWLAAIAILAIPFAPYAFTDADTVFETYADWGATVVALLVALLLLTGLLAMNRRLQFRFVYEEISKSADSRVKHLSSLTFLNRFGQTGEYLKLEVKSVMRNKVMRSRFWTSMVVVTVFCCMVAYTPVYNDRMSVNFWCFYCFGLYGVTSLVKVMCPEGNYIDLLMTRRENILSLLHAKYYFHCAVLIVPLLIMIPAMTEGKMTLLMVVSYLFLCSGMLYLILFQLAIYNNQTLLLEQKLTGKGNIENGRQLVIELLALFVPVVLIAVLQVLFPSDTAYIIQMAVGIALTLAHPLWLRHVYRRMMARRYENIEGFCASR